MQLSKNIKAHEIECQCGCGFNKMSQATISVVQSCRDHFNKSVYINDGNHSGCRCESHNKRVGGKSNSKHLPDLNDTARATDFHVEGVSIFEVFSFLNSKYPSCLGIGLYDTFIHVDDRLDRAYRWDMRTKK